MSSTQSYGLIHETIESQSLQTPDAIAVTFQGQQLTYQELNQKANQVAHYLQSLGVKPETLVGVCIERSLEMVIALLAVLKSGGAYIPLDPSYPADRLAFMVEDSALPITIAKQSQLENLPQNSTRIIVLEQEWETIDLHSTENPISAVTPENAAYTIYTSGSTGKPKGVQVLHRTVVNLLESMRLEPGLTAQDTILAVITISFDMSIPELFLPLSVGAQIVVASDREVSDGALLAQAIATSGTTVMQATPATWRLLLATGWQGNQQLKIICGGEAMTRDLADRLLERCASLWNMYGPTETTVYSAIYQVQPGIEAIPIGHPVANTQIYTISEQCRRKDDPLIQSAPGQPGEVYIGGDGLARGYLNQPEMTAERFLPDPFSTKPGARLYRTGDLARILPDGNIQYMGRVDNQVKIRGYRIELGDIEAAIGQYVDVRENAVTVREDRVGEKRLVAYITPKSLDSETDDLATSNPADLTDRSLGKWQDVWCNTYSQPEVVPDLTFNITGWTSSYTGQLIPEEAVYEWMDCNVKRILALQPQRLLEIGCGMGMVLYRVAPHCTQYLGTDISIEAINYIEKVLAQNNENWDRVSLSARAADAIEISENGQFDTVVLNSVIQYFPSIDYLVRVLENSLQKLAPGGRIFVGDVRSLQLLEFFHTSVQLYQAADALSTPQLRQRIQERITQDKELVVDPAFFTALQHHLPQISHVEMQIKRGVHQGELVDFRYDVVLHVGADISTLDAPLWLDWHREGLSCAKISQLLSAPEPEFIGITNIPNARLSKELAAIELLATPDCPSTVAELRAALLDTLKPGIQPEQLWQIGKDLGYEVEINWSGLGLDGSYDVAFYKKSTANKRQMVNFPIPKAAPQPWSVYANQPFINNISSDLIPRLRVFLQEKLPEYMVPSAFVLMETLPLTPNGKIDRRALPAPSSERPALDELFVAPRNEIEQKLANIWSQHLEIHSIGIHDNFFDLGGHSLFVAQMMTQVAETFEVVLPLSCLFKAPTIAGLAQSILSAQQSLDSTELQEPDLLADAILSPSIFPENIGIDRDRAPQNILLTGATGFLGAFLLDELLQSTQANIYCLVRCANLEVGREKLQRNLKRYALHEAAQSDRVIPLLGDLAKPLFGLTELQFHKLASQIDLIYHNGAFVNLIYPYAALRDINVLGTQEILRLASQVKIKPVHYVSTVDVFQSERYAQTDLLLEQEDFEGFAGPESSYAQSKWVAEKLLMAARERGIPTCIYRTGMIVGDSRTGVSKTEDLLCRFIKGSIQLKTVPKLSVQMHLTPVDYISKAMVYLSLQSSSWGHSFHLADVNPLSLEQLGQHIESLGYPLQQIEYHQWQATLLGPEMNSDNAFSPLVPIFTANPSPESNYLEVLNLTRVSCQNTIAGLAGTSINCPVMDTDLLNTYFAYFIQSGFLDRPEQPQLQAQPQISPTYVMLPLNPVTETDLVSLN
jgi:amino acid adenylation domain-containing protein/thioester reductase-like protein